MPMCSSCWELGPDCGKRRWRRSVSIHRLWLDLGAAAAENSLSVVIRATHSKRSNQAGRPQIRRRRHRSADLYQTEGHSQGRSGYRQLNQLAMQVLDRDGLLVSCSCSYHLSESALRNQKAGGTRVVCADRRSRRAGSGPSDSSGHRGNALSEGVYIAW